MKEAHHAQAAATIAANNVATSGNSNRKLKAKINQVCYAWIKMPSKMWWKQTIHFPIDRLNHSDSDSSLAFLLPDNSAAAISEKQKSTKS
jgi:hypothetical protein